MKIRPMKITLIALACIVPSAFGGTMMYTQNDFMDGVLRFEDYTLNFTEDWDIKCSVTVGEGQYNQYGTAVLASGVDPLASVYLDGFQVFLNTSEEILTKFYEPKDDAGWSSTIKNTKPGDVLVFDLNYRTDTAQLIMDITRERDGATDRRTAAIGSQHSPIAALSTCIGRGGAQYGFIAAQTTDNTVWAINSLSVTAASVPEPSTCGLSLLGLSALLLRRRRA